MSLENVDWMNYVGLAVIAVVLNRSHDVSHMLGLPMLDIDAMLDWIMDKLGLDHVDDNRKLTMVGLVLLVGLNVLVLGLLKDNLLEDVLM